MDFPRILDVGREGDRNGSHFLQNRASHQNNLAPLICRVVRAVRVRGRWAWIPGWVLRSAPVFTPNLRFHTPMLEP